MANQQYKPRPTIRSDRRNRLLSRALYYQRRTPFHPDSFSSLNGLSIGAERRGEAEQKREITRRWNVTKMKFLKTHPLTTSYCAVTMIVGIIWQVGFNG